MIERSEIEALFSDLLDMISDEELRTKVIDAWMLALEEGSWSSINELEQMPFTLLTETHGINFIEHTLAVTYGAVGMAHGQIDAYKSMPYEIDMDRLVAGALLHDVGKLVEIERLPDGTHRKSRNGMCARHPISGAIIAARVGLPDEIVNTIACHAKEGEGRPKVVETILIHQADFGTFDPLVMKAKGTLIT